MITPELKASFKLRVIVLFIEIATKTSIKT
jgi:hypothetical protein